MARTQPMPTRVPWKQAVENELEKVREKALAMELLFGQVAAHSRDGGLVGPHHREARALVAAFYDALHSFVEACFWVLNAYHRCGARPALGFRKDVSNRAAGSAGLAAIEAFLRKWSNEEDRRHLLHHNSGTSYHIQMGPDGVQVFFHDDVPYLKRRIEERSAMIAAQAFYEEPDAALSATALPVIDHMQALLDDARRVTSALESLPT